MDLFQDMSSYPTHVATILGNGMMIKLLKPMQRLHWLFKQLDHAFNQNLQIVTLTKIYEENRLAIDEYHENQL